MAGASTRLLALHKLWLWLYSPLDDSANERERDCPAGESGQRDCWLASDGDTVRAVTIHSASAALVARIRSRFDDLRSVTAGLELSSKTVPRIVDAIVREERHLQRHVR